MYSESNYQHGTTSQTGILLVNLGTPNAPTAEALRPYLKEFLSNRRVIEVPRLVWWFILNGIILNTRPKRSAEKYAQIWLPEGSPLKVYTERQTQLLAQLLSERGHAELIVEYAMNIGNPSVEEVMTRMKEKGCERILVVPLFPQYAASSTAAAMDNVFSELMKMRNIPEVRFVKQYHDHRGYVTALAQNVRDYWDKNGQPDKLVMSFHGVPRASLDKGDPYHCYCQKTARLVAEALSLNAGEYQVCFQSRFGKAEWLKPYTAETLKQLAEAGTKRVDIICPGFVSDCLETLEEIAMEAKETFIEAGGQDYHYIPCLNERNDWINALADIALSHLQGWLDITQPSQDDMDQSRKRALDLGAKM